MSLVLVLTERRWRSCCHQWWQRGQSGRWFGWHCG